MGALDSVLFFVSTRTNKNTIITSASFIHSIKDIVIVKRRHQRRARGGCQWFSSLCTAVDAPAGAA